MSKLHKHIVFVHLLNDYSGSPLVLSQVINTIDGSGTQKTLFTSGGKNEGFLSGLPGVETRFFWYRWQANPWMRLAAFMCSQAMLFFRLLRYWRTDVTIYVNTLLPFGAALAGKLMNKRVIYHVHETSMKPALLKTFLRWVANYTAATVIHVSKYLAENEHFTKPENKVVYNSLSASFIETARTQQPAAVPGKNFTVLMLCSLKVYKGIDEFVSLAHRLPELQFELVLNAAAQEVNDYFSKSRLPKNLVIHAVQKNVHPFYRRASLLINLSHPDKWIETFGMTVLEGMYYRLPVIVPPVGGVAELAEDGVNGFLTDSRDIVKLAGQIRLLATQPARYGKMSRASYSKALLFTGPLFQQQIAACLNSTVEESTIPILPKPYKSISI